MKNIKILATIGPSSFKKEIIQKMDSFGVDLFRLNLSHTKIEDFKNFVKEIKQWTKKPICIDTEGAQIRTGKFKKDKILAQNNSIVSLVPAEILGDKKNIPLYPIIPHKVLKEGDILYLDFHNVIIQVIKINGKEVKARILEGGWVGSNKGVNMDRPLDLPAFTKKDLAIFQIAKKEEMNYIALSFASRKEDIEELRKIFQYPIFVISKIESRKGVENVEEICRYSDAILIDRMDLSRDIPLQKIGLAQKSILDTVKKIKKPVFVATNLLDAMMENFQPTRSEINDITNILLSGASGLVLAAETAIGKHPAECVRMASGIIKEVIRYQKEKDKKYLTSIYDYNLIEPHGGELVQNIINKEAIQNIDKLPKLKISKETILDVVQIVEGTYSPLRGFMDFKNLISVLDNYRLSNGIIWTLPILLQATKKEIKFKEGETVALLEETGKEVFALINVSEIKKIDLEKIAKKWFGTTDKSHPGVVNFKKKGDYIIAGEVFLIEKPNSYAEFYALTPKQSREIFKNFGWQKIVGFHTRNVIHRGHEFIQKEALKKADADALFISPVIGPKKKGDFTAQAIVSAYEVMINKKYYHPYSAIIGAFATYSRYSGPREAVFTALCRKNFGCSHFIVGRDHTGVGNFYKPDASQKIFQKIGDIGIVPLFFNTAYFCKKCGQVTDYCRHGEESKITISGTKIRNCLINNEKIPDYLMRNDISKMLKDMYKSNKDILFEKGE